MLNGNWPPGEVFVRMSNDSEVRYCRTAVDGANPEELNLTSLLSVALAFISLCLLSHIALLMRMYICIYRAYTLHDQDRSLLDSAASTSANEHL